MNHVAVQVEFLTILVAPAVDDVFARFEPVNSDNAVVSFVGEVSSVEVTVSAVVLFVCHHMLVHQAHVVSRGFVPFFVTPLADEPSRVAFIIGFIIILFDIALYL